MSEANLTLQDLAGAVTIIDICVKRGAIEGNELSAVGTIRDKIANYVEANKPPAETAETATEETASE